MTPEQIYHYVFVTFDASRLLFGTDTAKPDGISYFYQVCLLVL